MGGVPGWLKDAGHFVLAGPLGFAADKLGLNPVYNAASSLLNPPSAPNIQGPPSPPPPPDLTDEEIQKARAAMVRRQLMGQGTASTFLTGPLGSLTAPTTSRSAAGGV